MWLSMSLRQPTRFEIFYSNSKILLVLKKRQANLVLEILEKKKRIQSKSDFLEVCRLTDKVAMLNYSKKRTITAADVEKVLFPDDPDNPIL